MKTSSNQKSSRRNDRKVLVAEESTKSWADSDSDSSSSSSSSSDSEQEEVHCFMADHASDDEVFDFANTEFTREDIVQALNDMVHEYKTLYHTFEEIKARKHYLASMASTFITYSYQINFESVLMIHDHEGMFNMFKALEASGLRRFLGCESVLYEKELGHFFDTALIQGEDITGVISGKFVSISPTLFAQVFVLPTEGITNFSEVPKDTLYDARSLFSKEGVQIDVHGKNKYMKHEIRLLNDILAKALTVKAGSFDSVTVERFQMMKAIHYGLKVNWSKVFFNVLKYMVDRSQRKAKGFAAQIGVLLKGIPTITMGDGVPFPSAKILSMKTVHTYIVTNTTIDARAESEEPGMAKTAVEKKTPKEKKKTSSADEIPVDIFAEIAASKKRSATEADAPIITKKRRTGKSKPSVSHVNLDIVQVAPDVEPLQIVDPTHAVAAVPSPVLKRKSRKRRLVLSRGSDDESVGTKEIVKVADADAVASTDEADIIIAKVLEETLELGVSSTEREGQGVDEAMFEEDFARWLDDFVARHNEPEPVDTTIDTQAEGSINSVVDKEMNISVDRKQVTDETMPIDDLLLQISDDLLLPSITAAEVTMIRLGAFSSTGDKGKAKLVEDEQITENPAREIVALICRDVEVLVQVRDSVMQAVVDFFASFSLNTMPDMESLKDLKEKEKLMMAWAETNTLAIAVRRQLYVLTKYREMLLHIFLESSRRYLAPDQPWTDMAVQVINLLSAAHSQSLEDLTAQQQEHKIEMGVACHSFVDSVVQRDLGDLQEVVLTDVEEVDLVSSDVSTVYRSPSPFSPAVDSFENDWRLALGPAIFSRVEQEERLYIVQSPESSPAISPHHASSSSSTDVSMHFDSTDIPVNAQADTQASASVDFTMFIEALEDLRSSLAQRIHDSNCEMLSKLNAVELGVRGDLLKVQSLLRQSFETACRVLEKQGNTQTAQITDLKKGLMAPERTFGLSIKVAADILSLSTQVGDIADYLRGGAAKKGEIGSSSRPSTMRTQTQTFPPTTGTFEERVEQARRHIIETGQVLSIEEAAERVIEADRRESDRLERERERERRERRQSSSGTYKRRR
ncbi:delphilin-like [Dorcoceras hygrometricum]|uniref:Delphilin-like n=1 Tax=Dorcoceras hygrometricum TaxID=472368 RepID=A0A2Z7BE77_9LAMI|nr:delphilin-like [Dorcoceras hygrometricum]